MLDTARLSLNIPLISNGWDKNKRFDVKKHYKECVKNNEVLQCPFEEIFPAAMDIIESLEGVCFKNPHRHLGLGDCCDAVEFNFFNYDHNNIPKLKAIEAKINKKVLFIGIGYDIIGDYLVDESGNIYFLNEIKGELHRVSSDIYNFLESDIYKLTDMDGKEFL